MEFAGGASASFTMTAWSAGRDIEIFGTKGILRGGEFVKRSSGSDIIVLHQDTGHEERHSVNPEIGGYEGHGGGDPGLMLSLHSEMMRERPEQMTSSIQRSVESHLMAFAAEKARVASRRILLQDLKTGD
jgi:hypothetical protein